MVCSLHMRISKSQFATALIAVGVILVIAAVAYYVFVVRVVPFPIDTRDALTEWNFKGLYAGNDALIADARKRIDKLTNLLGVRDEFDDYDHYIGIGNDYLEIGDGRAAYDAYNKAIHIHPKKGLAYVNMGHLMDLLHAPQTAISAYEKAVVVEPGNLQYHLQRLDYLTRAFPHEQALLEAAFADAAKVFGDTPATLAILAQWKEGLGLYAQAIKAWQAARQLSSESRQEAIDAEIVRLQKKIK